MKVPIWFLAVFVALCCGFFIGGATAQDNTLFGQTVAAWVQAIGAVAAILWGVWLFRVDTKRRRGEEAEREARFGRSFTKIAALLSAQMIGAERISQHRDLRDGKFSELTFDRFRCVDEMLADLPAEALAETGLAFEAVTARGRIGMAIRRCMEFNNYIDEPESEERTKALEEIRTSISRLRQYFELGEMALRQRYPDVAPVKLDAE